MDAKILGEFNEGKSICYLSSISLKDYITSLPANYKEYEVQREIVSNTYLDGLINTITFEKHIPPIVLVLEEDSFKMVDKVLNIKTFKILDGLQRTFRLKVIFDTIELIEKELQKGVIFQDFSKLQIAKNYKSNLEAINSSTAIFWKLIEYYKTYQDKLSRLFDRDQWFEIWINLDTDEEVNKMLILNAGHKSVKTKHQLELLFRNILPLLKKTDVPDLIVVREKDAGSAKIVKERKAGQYLFSNLITSLLSYSEAKPMTTNIDLIQKSQNDQFNDDLFDELLKPDFLKVFLKSLITLDKNLASSFGPIGTQWLGRETSLVGIYAALGEFAKGRGLTPIEAINLFEDKVVNDVSILKLREFELARNSLDLAKINFGIVNKRAVFKSIKDILENDQVTLNWDSYFKAGS